MLAFYPEGQLIFRRKFLLLSLFCSCVIFAICITLDTKPASYSQFKNKSWPAATPKISVEQAVRLHNNSQLNFSEYNLRKEIRMDLKELWYIANSLKNISEDQREILLDIIRLIQSNLIKFGGEDQTKMFRKEVIDLLSNVIQAGLHRLQNPPDCEIAKKLVCSLSSHINAWNYDPGANAIYVTDNMYFRIARNNSIPSYLPLAIPSDIADILEKVHAAPDAWWIAQFVKYLLRLQPHTKKMMDEAKSQLQGRHPIAGIQVRRTDKVVWEAKNHSLEEYMIHVKEFFRREELVSGKMRRYPVFIATDEPQVLAEASATFKDPKWEIFGNKSIATSASVQNRTSSLLGVLKDMFLLADCDFVVCTFSSNMCRLVYEIKLGNDINAPDKFVSIDKYFIYVRGSGAPIHRAILAHEPKHPWEMELQLDDKIVADINFKNGTSQGRNQRTNKIALYPSFKVRDSYTKVKLPIEKYVKYFNGVIINPK